jgi:hypothetical protein
MDETPEIMNQNEEDEAAKKKKLEDDWEAVKWLMGLLFAGFAWLFGRWLFGSSEPQAWWVWIRRVYFGGVYIVAAVQVVLGLSQLFVLIRKERERHTSEPRERKEGTDPWPKNLAGWVRHITLALIGFILLAAFIAICIGVGYVIESIKAWFLSWFS